MNHYKCEEVLKVFIKVYGTVISYNMEGIEFFGYTCLLIDSGERDASYVVTIISLGVKWYSNIIHNILDSGLNGARVACSRVSTCPPSVTWLSPIPNIAMR